MIFFFDHCLSHKYAAMLVALGEDVRALGSEFPLNTPDEDWIVDIGRRGWVLVTADRHIRTKPHQRLALAHARVTSFFLGKSFDALLFWERAIALLKAWPHLRKMAEQTEQGRTYGVTIHGKIEPY